MELKNCLYCEKSIPMGSLSNSDYNRKKFCNSSCAASYNNKMRIKKKKYCLVCGKEIPLQNIFCSISCHRDFEYKEYIQRWKDGLESGLIGNDWKELSGRIRRYIFEKYDFQCARCGWSEVNPFTGTLPLEIEHIDGDATNNSEENLILLCPNCHSLTATYRGANKGHGMRDIKWLSRNYLNNKTNNVN